MTVKKKPARKRKAAKPMSAVAFKRAVIAAFQSKWPRVLLTRTQIIDEIRRVRIVEVRR